MSGRTKLARLARTTDAGTHYHVSTIGKLDAMSMSALDAIANAAADEMRTPKQRVLAKYPESIAWPWADCVQIYSKRHNSPPLGNKTLGTGKTARQAWADAARSISYGRDRRHVMSCGALGGRSPLTGKRVGSRHRWSGATWGMGTCDFCHRTLEEVTAK